KARERMPLVWPLSVVISRLPTTSHSRIVLSPPPETSVCPSGANTTQYTAARWPCRVATSCRVETSQSFTVPSSLPEASSLPSGENVRAFTPPLCFRRLTASRLVATSHSFTSPGRSLCSQRALPVPVARVLPSGENDKHRTLCLCPFRMSGSSCPATSHAF